MKEWILDNVFTLLTAIFGGGSFYAFLTEKKKRKLELQSTEANALSQMQLTYDKFVEDFTEKYQHLQKELAEVKSNYHNLQKKLDASESKYQNLKREFENYKKNHS